MSSLDHTQFRQYTSQLAHWISPDPAGLLVADPSNPQSWNRYSYVLNNPMNFTDPSGLGPQDCNNGMPTNPDGVITCGDPCSLPSAACDGGGVGGIGPFGGGGGGGGQAPPPLTGETNGIPNGLPIPGQTIWQIVGIPIDDSCEFGPCILGFTSGGGLGFLRRLNACVANNAKNYSIGGFANLVFNTQIPGSGVAGNDITDAYLLLTGQDDSLLSALKSAKSLGGKLSKSSPIMTNGPNSLTTISPVRGSPQPVLGPGRNYRLSLFGKAARLVAELKEAADIGLAGALVLNCSLGQVQ